MNEAKTAATAGTGHEQQITGPSAKTDKAGNSNMKYCKACGATITAKHRSKYCSNECSANKRRELRNKNNRLRYKNNPEKYREISREAARQWYRNNPKRARENSSRWYRNNTEKATESSMRWKKKNPEKVREYVRRCEAKRRKIIKENTEKWVENYLAKVREGARIEREAEEENTGGGLPPHKAVVSMPTGGEIK